MVIVPMFINMEPYGYFGIGMQQSANQVSKVELELIHALTQQASLAIQLARLAEESKLAALAHERGKDAEVRAEEFANANEVLRSMLDQLSKERDLHSFPRTILKEAMKQAGARDGLILLFDKQTDTLNPSEYINATGLPPSVEFSSPFQASRTPAWVALISKRSPIVFDVELDGEMLLSGLAEWHRRRGNRSIIAAAMFIDSEPYGYFGITLAERAGEVSKVKVGLIHALTQQATLAIQLTRLAEASQQAAIMVERQQLVVEERANMAREIHDKLAQGYAAILMQQHAMRDTLLSPSGSIEVTAPLVKHLDTIERVSRENLTEARRTMDKLRIDPFGPADLGPALEQCIRQVSDEHQFAVSLQLEEGLPPLRRYVETELCRIMLEAVTNSRKHARSDSTRVVVSKSSGGVQIAVRDDGVGFDLRTIGSSFGISSMRERAARAGAAIEITSEPGHGTEVKIIWMP